MRNLIVGLSLIFFALSGIILFKALNIPVNHTQQQNDPDGLKTKAKATAADDTSEKHQLKKEANKSMVQDLQAAATVLTDEGRIKNRRVEIKLIPEDKEL